MKKFRRELNIRDLGGLPVKDGRHVVSGQFIRSSALGDFDEEELRRLQKMGIQTILDFRSKGEAEKLPDPVIPGANMLRVSAIRGADTETDISPSRIWSIAMKERGRDKIGALINKMYAELPFDSEAYRLMFREIQACHTPILFHCTAGKDRTGVAAMLILLALGADEETIRKDYMRTNHYRRKKIEERLSQHPILSRISVNVRGMIMITEGVRADSCDATLQAIRERYGNYDRYFLEEYGMGEKELTELRNRYLAL